MRTVQMTLDEDLVKTVDHMAKALKTTRSAFTRDALRQAIGRMRIRKQEGKHRLGYGLHPVPRSEFGVWESEQKWGDE